MNLKEYLQSESVSEELSSVFISISEAIKKIATAMRTGSTGKADSENIFGEQQIKLDIVSNEIMVEELRQNSTIGLVASEEMEDELEISAGNYACAFDPFDGSSLVDVNLAVGTIVGIYQMPNIRGEKSFIGARGADQCGALIAVYGPRTTILLTFKKGVKEFRLTDEGDFVISRDDIEVKEGKMFAPGNLRASAFREDYLKLVNFWCKEQYTLRYSGGMVPDVAQIMLKGKGIFSYPGYQDAPDGKLRILYECAPMALLMEQAGGSASDGKIRILEKEILKLDQRTPIFIGSSEEVKRCETELLT